LKIIDELHEKGADVQFSDPFFNTIPPTRKHTMNLQCKPLTTETLQAVDLALLITDHDQFDYDLIIKNAELIVDTRGRLNNHSKVIIA